MFSEAVFLFAQKHGILIPLHNDIDRIAELLNKYSDVPMDAADGCLVRLSERHPKLPVVTIHSDFLLYRRFRSERIPLISPFA